MVSSGNFGVFEQLIRPGGGPSYPPTLSHSNLKITSSAGSWGAPLTIAANSGKWYVEFYVQNGSSGRNVGVVPTISGKYNQGNYNQPATGDYAVNINSGGSIYNNNSVTQSVGSNQATGDIMAVALNLDASPRTVQFYQNNSTIGSVENINASAEGPFAFMAFGHNQSIFVVNAGQDSTFTGEKTSGSANASDDNGFGDFYYTPPSGFLAMCSANLPISADIDPGGDDGSTDNPSTQCGVVTYTGNASTNNITGLGFQPDLTWIKVTNTASNHVLNDSSRGTNKILLPNQTNAEITSGNLTSFDSDGFSLDGTSDYQANFNGSGNSYVAWCWRCAGGTTSSNSNGASTTTVQVNQKAGFSIVEFPNYTPSSTFGHGLSQAPTFIWANLLTGAQRAIYHSGMDSGKIMYLNSNNGQFTSSIFNSTAPTSTVFSLGASYAGSGAGIAYCWHDVEGYSKFGKFTANNYEDGPVIYLGFKPSILILKGLVTGSAWIIKDDTLDTFNPGAGVLQPSSDAAKYTSAGGVVDILSSGFKIRTNNAVANSTSYDPYIYMAWASTPFKYTNTL